MSASIAVITCHSSSPDIPFKNRLVVVPIIQNSSIKSVVLAGLICFAFLVFFQVCLLCVVRNILLKKRP